MGCGQAARTEAAPAQHRVALESLSGCGSTRTPWHAKVVGVIGTFNCLVIDCPEPRALADFYERLLGLDRVEESDKWVTLGNSSLAPRIALQGVAEFVSPDWHSSGAPQQMHVDVLVENLDVAQAAVLSLGARLLEGSDKPIGYRVYADPVGHPFCLVTKEGLT